MSENQANQVGGNFAFASGALATATTTSAVKTTVVIPYTIDGQFASKAITDNMSIAYTSATAAYGEATNGAFTGGANGSTRLYGIYLDSAGALTVFPGPIVDSVALSNGAAPLLWPNDQRRKVMIGVLRIALTAGTTFIPGTTLLGAAGVTASFLNTSCLPGEPLTS